MVSAYFLGISLKLLKDATKGNGLPNEALMKDLNDLEKLKFFISELNPDSLKEEIKLPQPKTKSVL